MKKVLAISGGVDSVSMLHMMRHDPEILVAHFNHGIRQNSDADENFVQQLAKSYGLPFTSKKAHLGPSCSEATARQHRYNFLNEVCQKNHGEIYTAHHQNDLIETIIINLVRGTGWRGLVPLDDPQIHRPLINMTKSEIYQYAAKHNLIWRHDPTNTEDHYLRNRIRHQNIKFDIELYQKQKQIKQTVDQILQDILPPNNTYERSWFLDLDDNLAIEILRAGLAKIDKSATRPELADFLHAIRTYSTNKKFNLNSDHLVTIGRTTFVL